ncbi:carboxypeptidase-like regulatory domain-containing protein [Alloacidobacterium sp.]|uniref:carboxypeptidase-like regulatory domain-containing protein n=1 Tax=Alloacidobacterium sp. TaxID=2951999 RepID=UPI002D54AD44|nr:carboxypeptidase-like regulatory domain-containing protein [Alloacidobacterium sp.]HYK34465.1 carboxypeptidase-like regulatory domain-containing protein [Alloacidobacterium sp.]
MNTISRVHTRRGLKQELHQLRGKGYWLLSLIGMAFLFLSGPSTHAQTTAQLTGTVQDSTGGVIPGAQVTLINESTASSRVVQTNGQGLYAFPALVPGSYTVKVNAKGFQAKEVTGITLHAGDIRAVPAFTLVVGSEATTVTVNAASEMIPTESGQRTNVLDSKQIQNLALVGRDTTELLKVLPGATSVSSGLTQNSPMYNDLNTSVQQSAIGNGIDINGAVNRGGTALLADGANIIDPGNMASSVSVVNPEMTAEVSVQASNFSADTPFGPVVVSTISKSGSDRYHGEAYFDARNSVLNANDWQSNHQGIAQGAQHYYYPGGNFGGPVPGTNKKLFFWGGYERWLQNQGNANVLKSYIPSPEMMAGDFTTDNADNNVLCPSGFYGSPTGKYPQGAWCNDLSGTIFPDGSSVASNNSAAPNSGNKIPAQFIDPGAQALAKIWPKANANPATTPGGYNYYQPIENINNGWIYRFRIDYQLGENTKIYGSYQQAYDAQLAQGNGAHLYWTPGNAIPYPGGGESEAFYGKSLAGHFVHNFNSTTTNDFMAAWAFGSFPFVQPNPSAASRTTLGYPYGKVFQTTSLNIPAYSSAGNFTFPDFSQASIFENPPGKYAVKKEAPQFNDVLTKVWGAHTVKMGAFTQNTDNYQSTFSTFQDGSLTIRSGQAANIITGNQLGSYNPVANFTMGVLTGYSENNASPIADTAYQATAFFVDDTWKTTSRLTLNLGARVEHIGHWYDRGRVGMAVFYPDRVLSDFNSGKYAPGYYWHAIDAGVPLNGQPNRFAYFDPRFGLAYDVFGTGNTVLRGGWGAYRFVTQVNDVAAPLVTAQHVLGYNLPGQKTVMLSQLSQLAYKPCTVQCVSGSQTGFDPTDYGQPLTYAYNLTIDQRLKWNSLLDIAYVGSQTSQLSDNSEGIEGSNFSALADQNKTPIGAFFKPDPVTGVLSTNPENLGTNPGPGGGTPTGNTAADYHPYGYAYGTSTVLMNQSTSYTNYNGLQVAWIKTSGHLNFNLNGTWSRTLGTSLQTNPFDINLNYGPTSVDRPFVFNASYTYQTGAIHDFNRFVNGLLGGWTISGISTWQAGGYIPAQLGNGVPNFGLGLTYATGLPADAKAQGINKNIGDATYFGTDASVPIMPVLTCNPTTSLSHYQRVNGNCFIAPPVGSQGGKNYPYMSAGAYFNNDLALYRSFPIHEQQQIQFRISAFNWMNHPLPGYSSLNPLTLSYNVDYASKAITRNYNTSTFGVMDNKTGAPYQRIIELNVKYFF